MTMKRQTRYDVKTISTLNATLLKTSLLKIIVPVVLIKVKNTLKKNKANNSPKKLNPRT